MSAHDSIGTIAAKAFNQHTIEGAPAQSWRLAQPNKSAYAFRVTWAPGILCVSGDIGRAVYELWPAFATLVGAVKLVANANFDYLCEKSGFEREFDRETTVEHLIEGAYEARRGRWGTEFFEQICREYRRDVDVLWERKEAVRSFRDDCDLTAERVYSITGDFEGPLYRYPAQARWAFEAVKLWAAKMQAAAPAVGEAA